MVASDLYEVESIGGIDAGICSDKTSLEIRIFAEGAFSKGMVDEELASSHKCWSHDQIREAMLALGKTAHNDITTA